MIIDSHQHFWEYKPSKDSWIDESMNAIRKDFLPKDLKDTYVRHNIDGCIAVQAEQSEEENQLLLDLAHKNPFIRGVVGWLDLCAYDINEKLAKFSSYPLFKGVRHILQSEQKGFTERKQFQNGIAKLGQFNLTYDILVYPNQLEESLALVQKFPNQPFVLDHMGKPDIKSGKIEDWKKKVELLAECKNVFCKLSGMVTEADWYNWSFQDLKPYVDVIFDSFGTDRILFGSDWPVCLLAAEYEEVFEVTQKFIKSLSDVEQALIMGGNAAKVYKLDLS
ncbi:MAG: amidohydrolase family protein [Bacteroidota bacterium]